MASRIMEYTIHNYFFFFFFFKLHIYSIHNEPVCLSGDFVLVKRVNFTAEILKWQWLHLKTVKMVTVASKHFYLLQCFSLTYSQYLRKDCCGGLTLAGRQASIKATLSLPFSARQRRENIMKSPQVQIKIGIDQSPVTVYLDPDFYFEINALFLK